MVDGPSVIANEPNCMWLSDADLRVVKQSFESEWPQKLYQNYSYSEDPGRSVYCIHEPFSDSAHAAFDKTRNISPQLRRALATAEGAALGIESERARLPGDIERARKDEQDKAKRERNRLLVVGGSSVVLLLAGGVWYHLRSRRVANQRFEQLKQEFAELERMHKLEDAWRFQGYQVFRGRQVSIEPRLSRRGTLLRLHHAVWPVLSGGRWHAGARIPVLQVWQKHPHPNLISIADIESKQPPFGSQAGPQIIYQSAPLTVSDGTNMKFAPDLVSFFPGPNHKPYIPLVARAFFDLSAALAHLHQHGIGHYDVSAGNAVLTGRVVLVDPNASESIEHPEAGRPLIGRVSHVSDWAPGMVEFDAQGRPIMKRGAAWDAYHLGLTMLDLCGVDSKQLAAYRRTSTGRYELNSNFAADLQGIQAQLTSKGVSLKMGAYIADCLSPNPETRLQTLGRLANGVATDVAHEAVVAWLNSLPRDQQQAWKICLNDRDMLSRNGKIMYYLRETLKNPLALPHQLLPRLLIEAGYLPDPFLLQTAINERQRFNLMGFSMPEINELGTLVARFENRPWSPAELGAIDEIRASRICLSTTGAYALSDAHRTLFFGGSPPAEVRRRQPPSPPPPKPGGEGPRTWAVDEATLVVTPEPAKGAIHQFSALTQSLRKIGCGAMRDSAAMAGGGALAYAGIHWFEGQGGRLEERTKLGLVQAGMAVGLYGSMFVPFAEAAKTGGAAAYLFGMGSALVLGHALSIGDLSASAARWSVGYACRVFDVELSPTAQLFAETLVSNAYTLLALSVATRVTAPLVGAVGLRAAAAIPRVSTAVSTFASRLSVGLAKPA